MDIILRTCQADDMAGICRLPQNEDELFFMFPGATYPLQVDELERSLQQRRNATVALVDDTIVGFANFYIWEQGGRCAIGNVVVAAQARRSGVATRLMAHMVNLAREVYQASEVTVSCFNHNVAGLLLYPKLGFQAHAIEERRSKHGERLALIHFTRTTP